MTEPTEAMKAMARRVAQENAEAMLECLFGGTSSDTVKRVVHDGLKAAALAAIMETQEACARLIEATQPQFTSGLSMLIPRLEDNKDGLPYATAIRTGEHYALTGEDIGGGRG